MKIALRDEEECLLADIELLRPLKQLLFQQAEIISWTLTFKGDDKKPELESIKREILGQIRPELGWKISPARAKRVALSLERVLLPELLHEIFLFVAATPPNRRDKFAFPLAARFPPAIMNVSKRWRDIALSTPALFKTLRFCCTVQSLYSLQHEGPTSLRDPNPTNINPMGLVIKLESWLRLLRNETLDIEYSTAETAETQVPTVPSAQAWAMLLEHAPRWQRVNLTLRAWSPMGQLLRQNIKLSHLKEIHITLDRSAVGDNINIVTRPSLSVFPKLEILDITLGWAQAFEMMHINAPKLTSLSMEVLLHLNEHHIQQLNGSFPTLKTLEIRTNEFPHSNLNGNDLRPSHKPWLSLAHLEKCTIITREGPFHTCHLAGCHNLTYLRISLERLPKYWKQEVCPTSLPFVQQLDIGIRGSQTEEDADWRHARNFLSPFTGVKKLQLDMLVPHNLSAALTNLNWFYESVDIDPYLIVLQSSELDNKHKWMVCPLLESFTMNGCSMTTARLLQLCSKRSSGRDGEITPSSEFRISLMSCEGLPDATLVDQQELKGILERVEKAEDASGSENDEEGISSGSSG